MHILLCHRAVFSFFLFFFVSCLLLGCSAKEQFVPTTSLANFQKASVQQDKEGNGRDVVKAVPVSKDLPLTSSDYLLGPGDLLSIKVLEAQDLNTETRVSSQGNVDIPLLNDVNVLNLTVAEAERKVEGLYRERYLQNPHVSIYIKEHVSKQITVVGAVNHPGTYEYVTSWQLLDALAIGGGLTDKAGTLAFITRIDAKTGKTVNYMVDLDDLVRNGDMAQNQVILGGDIIFVPESGQCFVNGAVRKPGTYQLKGRMTVAEAIAMAGGLAGWADDNKIKLVRFMGNGKKREVVSLSYSDLQSGTADSVFLKDQDIIFAESSSSGKLFSGAGLTLGYLGTGVSFKDPER